MRDGLGKSKSMINSEEMRVLPVAARFLRFLALTRQPLFIVCRWISVGYPGQARWMLAVSCDHFDI
jgi:hypothetical protein